MDEVKVFGGTSRIPVQKGNGAVLVRALKRSEVANITHVTGSPVMASEMILRLAIVGCENVVDPFKETRPVIKFQHAMAAGIGRVAPQVLLDAITDNADIEAIQAKAMEAFPEKKGTVEPDQDGEAEDPAAGN